MVATTQCRKKMHACRVLRCLSYDVWCVNQWLNMSFQILIFVSQVFGSFLYRVEDELHYLFVWEFSRFLYTFLAFSGFNLKRWKDLLECKIFMVSVAATLYLTLFVCSSVVSQISVLCHLILMDPNRVWIPYLKVSKTKISTKFEFQFFTPPPLKGGY